MTQSRPNINSFSPVTPTPKPTCLADQLIAIIETRRSEINGMDFGDVVFQIKHYSPFSLEMTRRVTGDALALTKKSIDTT